MSGVWAVVSLDLKRFWLDRVRLATGLLQPLLYLFVLGTGLGASTRMNGADYRHFIFPGVVALSLLFAATFAAILIVFDRQIGFLKAVLVAPVSRAAIALGKVISGALQALAQGTLLLCFAPLTGLHPTPLQIVLMFAAMVLAALTFSALGVALAARFNSTTVFPVMTNAVLLPMFFLSGALFPLQPAPLWMRTLAHFDPVAYAVDLMRGAVLGREAMFFHPALAVAVQAGIIALLTAEAVRVFQRGEEANLTGPSNLAWRRR